jgi:hypothetical protein
MLITPEGGNKKGVPKTEKIHCTIVYGQTKETKTKKIKFLHTFNIYKTG